MIIIQGVDVNVCPRVDVCVCWYNFDSSEMCGYHGVPVCPDPNERVSWDGIHLTQHA